MPGTFEWVKLPQATIQIPFKITFTLKAFGFGLYCNFCTRES
jgi:hypothetical protein